MEKCLIWYRLSLKQNIKKIGTWLLLGAMLFLLWIMGNVSIPDGTNGTVAIYYNTSEHATVIQESLKSSESQFEFKEYDSESEVHDAVEAGKAECGFVFKDDFDEGIADGDWDEIVTCYTTPFSTKTDVAKENLYAALFPIYSRWLLIETEDEIYRVPDEERLAELLEEYEANVGENQILSFEEIRIDVEGEKEEETKGLQLDSSIYPMQGLIELFVLLAMLLAAGVYGQKETAQIESALLVREKTLFRYINILSNGTLLAITGTCAILFTADSRGFGMEILSMLGVLLVGGLFVLGFSKLFKNRLTYLSWVVTFVICFLLLRFGVAGYITL